MSLIRRLAMTAAATSNVYRILMTGVLIASLLRRVLRRG